MKLSSQPGFHLCLSPTLRSESDPTIAEGPLTSFRPKRNATDHCFLGSRLRYWLCPSLRRPEFERASKPLLRVVRLLSAQSSNCGRRVKTFSLGRTSENYPSTHFGE